MKTVFAIKQYSKNGIERTAEILGARIIELDPYSKKYFENISETAKWFHEAMNEESSD